MSFLSPKAPQIPALAPPPAAPTDGGAAGIKADRQGMGAGGFASTLLTQVDSKQSAGRKSLIGT